MMVKAFQEAARA